MTWLTKFSERAVSSYIGGCAARSLVWLLEFYEDAVHVGAADVLPGVRSGRNPSYVPALGFTHCRLGSRHNVAHHVGVQRNHNRVGVRVESPLFSRTSMEREYSHSVILERDSIVVRGRPEQDLPASLLLHSAE